MGRGNAPDGGRRIITGVFVGYLAVVAFGVFGPAPGNQIRQAGDGVRKVADEIGATVPGRQSTSGATPARVRDRRLLGGIRDEAAANVALFVPLGVLFPMLFSRRQWWTVPVGVAASATIEGIQLVFLPWRSPSLADVAWNSLGVVIGFSLWLVARAWWRWRMSSPRRAMLCP